MEGAINDTVLMPCDVTVGMADELEPWGDTDESPAAVATPPHAPPSPAFFDTAHGSLGIEITNSKCCVRSIDDGNQCAVVDVGEKGITSGHHRFNFLIDDHDRRDVPGFGVAGTFIGVTTAPGGPFISTYENSLCIVSCGGSGAVNTFGKPRTLPHWFASAGKICSVIIDADNHTVSVVSEDCESTQLTNDGPYEPAWP